jgi:DNA-binding response OmpR family regulator
MVAGSETERRVLIVEDEMLIALMLQDMVADAGFAVEGIATSLLAGIDLARKADVHLAILDINLNGEEAYPIADILRARGVRLIFSTGYGAASLRPEYEFIPKLVKPYEQANLAAAIRAAFDRPPA